MTMVMKMKMKKMKMMMMMMMMEDEVEMVGAWKVMGHGNAFDDYSQRRRREKEVQVDHAMLILVDDEFQAKGVLLLHPMNAIIV